MSTNLSNDQAVMYLVSGYLNATDIFNKTLWYESTSPWDWLTRPTRYVEIYPSGSSTFCDTGNCIKDCQDLNQLFSSRAPTPFGVCMLFANVSRTLPNREIWTEDEASQFASFGFGDKSRGSFDAIATAVTGCLSDACTQNPNANHCAQSCSHKGLLINGSTPCFGGVSDCLPKVCSQDLSFADFDLAEIGVTISYFLQIVMAIFGIAYLLFMQKRSGKRGLSQEKRQSRQDRKDELTSSLVEFHKAQCFFVIAVQIAALTPMNKSDQTSPANLSVIPVTVTIRIQAPLFVYVAIARYGRQSSYLLHLTSAVWVLATVTMWVTYRTLFATYDINYQRQGSPSCGYKNLFDFCYTLNLDSGFSSDTLEHHVRFCFKAWLVIWAFQPLFSFRLRALKTFFNPGVVAFDARNSCGSSGARRGIYLEPEAESDSWLFYAVIGLLAGSLCVELYQLGYIWMLTSEDAGNWTFGQIVAMLAWAAPLAEFVNLTINGIINGSNFRFAKSLTLARVQRSFPALEMRPLPKQDSDGDNNVQLINPDDDALSAQRWSQQTIQEISEYNLEVRNASLE